MRPHLRGRVEPIDPASSFCMSVMNDFSEEADLVAQCESGFYVACDLLYLISSIGSPRRNLLPLAAASVSQTRLSPVG